jgi:pimeloyl-ACP methyl ester carboxylesterase
VQLQERIINTSGLRLRVVEAGEGPLVLMIHGFPGLAYSWRHQMVPLAAAGWQAVAIDCPGYGGSDRPLDQALYDSNQMQAYLLGVLDAYGSARAVIIGQDFGAQYAWNMAVRAPGRVAALVATIPYDYDIAGRAMLGSASKLRPDEPTPPIMAFTDRLPSERFAAMARAHFVHFHYFQTIGPADHELGDAHAEYLRRIFHALSAAGDLGSWKSVPSQGSGYLDALADAPPLPWHWLSEAEFATFVESYHHPDPMRRMIGGLNSYRTADANWVIGGKWADSDVETPTLFIHGARDPSFGFFPDWEPRLRRRVHNLRSIVTIPDAGHMVQQEQPGAFNAALLAFFETLR